MLWLNWLDRLILQPAGWVQLIALASAVLIAFLTRSGLTIWLYRLRDQPNKRWVKSVYYGAQQTLPIITPLLAIVFTALMESALEGANLPHDAFHVAFQLLTIWLVFQCIYRLIYSAVMRAVLLIVAVMILVLDAFGWLNPLIKISKNLALQIGDFKITLYSVVSSILALVILLWVTRRTHSAIADVLQRVSLRGSTRQLLLKTLSVTLYCVVGLVAMSILGIDITALAVFGGALGVGIGFGLQKIASNFISGVILLLEKSVEVDDLIDLGNGVTGFVRQTGARYTLVEVADGRAVMVPNEDFITQRVTNFTFLNRRGRIEVRVGVAYESDLALVKQVMLNAALNHPRCIHSPEPAVYVTELTENAVQMLLHFWVEDVIEGRMGPQSDVMTTILEAFRARNIKIPYPQREMHVITPSNNANQNSPQFPPER
jgi:small-conductance mechanosensitive channel